MTSRSIGYMDCFSGVWAGLLAWENSAERHEPPPKAELNFWDPTVCYVWSTQRCITQIPPHPQPPAAIASPLIRSVATRQASADNIRVCLSCKEWPHPRSCTSQGRPHPRVATEQSKRFIDVARHGTPHMGNTADCPTVLANPLADLH